MGDGAGVLPDAELAFRWRGGHAVLDFTATVGERWRRRIERLRVTEDLGRWLQEAGICQDRPVVSEAQLRAARALREAMYGVATAIRTGSEPTEQDLRLINEWATRPQGAPQLHFEASGLTIRRGTGVEAALSALAAAAVELLGGTGAACIRECAGDECALLFLDRSRGGSRRWCSMDECGVRAKMATYRSRRGGTTR